jgi:glutathione S-transferase
MQLYGSYTSPYVRHCRIALIDSGLPFELIESDQAASTRLSPTQRVPFLVDGKMQLSDSLAILAHIRQRQGQQLLSDPQRLNLMCLATTVLDSTINLFFLERDGLTVASSAYLQRQQARINSSLAELERQQLKSCAPFDDADLRLGVMIGWAEFRQRIDFTPYPKLRAFYQALLSFAPFAQTQPQA